jgi:hypothetical protein
MAYATSCLPNQIVKELFKCALFPREDRCLVICVYLTNCLVIAHLASLTHLLAADIGYLIYAPIDWPFDLCVSTLHLSIQLTGYWHGYLTVSSVI